MGQAQSRHERPGGFWRRRKPQATTQEPIPEGFGEMPSPPRQSNQTSMQMDQSSTNPSMSPTAADKTPASVAPFPNMLGDAMADTSDNKADQPGKAEIDKIEKQTSSPRDEPMADVPVVPANLDVLEKPGQPDVPIKPDNALLAVQADQPADPADPADQPLPTRPALKREFTPPHRIKIWSHEAWELERVYSNVHDHVTKTLNQIRRQQVALNNKRQGQADRRMQLDIYNACDSCTLSMEYLVGHFSTRFFHHPSRETIMAMLATIDSDATKLNDLRQRQRTMANYGYNLEKKVNDTETHIRELGDLAKQIKEMAAAEAEEEQEVDSEDHKDEDEDLDAEGDTDPQYDGKANGKWQPLLNQDTFRTGVVTNRFGATE